MVDITGLSKAKVLKALYDHSHNHGLGLVYAIPTVAVTEMHCQQLLDGSSDKYFDYLYDRVLKVDLSGNEFNEAAYDRENYPGAAQNAINILRYS